MFGLWINPVERSERTKKINSENGQNAIIIITLANWFVATAERAEKVISVWVPVDFGCALCNARECHNRLHFHRTLCVLQPRERHPRENSLFLFLEIKIKYRKLCFSLETDAEHDDLHFILKPVSLLTLLLVSKQMCAHTHSCARASVQTMLIRARHA